jgi:hypothetical protein
MENPKYSEWVVLETKLDKFYNQVLIDHKSSRESREKVLRVISFLSDGYGRASPLD